MNKGASGRPAVDCIEAFVREWINTVAKAKTAYGTPDFDHNSETAILPAPVGADGNIINRIGYDHLVDAAENLLREEKLQERVCRNTAIKVLSNAFFERRRKLRERGGRFSLHGLIADAKRDLASLEWADGDYVFPVIFAPKAKRSNFRCGPVRIIAKQIFLEERQATIGEERRKTCSMAIIC